MTKNLATLSLAVALVLVAACGPSSSEIKTARATTYSGAPAELFAATKSAVEEAHYQIQTSNDGDLTLETRGIWYNPDGQIDTSIDTNIARLQEDSINIEYTVKLVQNGGTWRVDVTPLIGRKHGLTSTPDKVDPEDPSLPGWVQGKTDSLAIHIHDKLKQYAVSGGAAPVTGAPAPAPAPAPAAPTAPAAPAPAPEPAAPAPTPAPAS